MKGLAMQRHLIRPHMESHGPVDAAEYVAQLHAAHDAIVERAIGWTHDIAGPSWGIRAKRTFVDLTGAHPMVTNEKHPISELLNICATVERLLGALRWAIQEGWAESVLECNPTTSNQTTSGISGPPDLRTKGVQGEAWFEVSDVVAARDGNRKLQIDLERLQRAPAIVATFLVASPSWEHRIQHRGLPYWKTPPDETIVARVSRNAASPTTS
jgi:hypothetical protein